MKTIRQLLQKHLSVSCPDGKPTEEPSKGRGRGFGGENDVTAVVVMLANALILHTG